MKSLTHSAFAELDAPLKEVLAPRYKVRPDEVDLQLTISAFSGASIIVRVDNERVETLTIDAARALLLTKEITIILTEDECVTVLASLMDSIVALRSAPRTGLLEAQKLADGMEIVLDKFTAQMTKEA